MAFNRTVFLNFVCITQQGRWVKVERPNEMLDFRVTIHVGSRDLNVSQAAPLIRQGYEYGHRRHR